ncbi:MAG: hypothetical protein FJ130_02995 [Deltaproteobacteria bacterium]|nr:hypothetical protein [Deltaproteobacteria bacterium]
MSKGAILFLAFSLFLSGCSPRMTVQPASSLPSIEPLYHPDEYFSGIPVEEEVAEIAEKVQKKVEEGAEEKVEEKIEKEEKQVVSHLAAPPMPAEPPKETLSLPDITVANLFLKQKRRLFATLTNIGTAPFSMESGGLSLFVDGRLEKRYALNSLSDYGHLNPQESITLSTPFSLFGRHEVEVRVDTPVEQRELNKENNRLKKILEGLPIGPDIVIRDFDLTEDLELSIILSNNGEADLRKGVTFRIRIYLNDRKISDFEHFIFEDLKAHSGNLYTLSPPYRVSVKGISRVRVSLAPKLRSDDIRMENNILERKFIIFPFQIGAQGREQFSFFVSSPLLRGEESSEKIKMELRWEGSSAPLKFSFGGSEDGRPLLDISGMSPLKVEWPIPAGETQRESHWRVSVTNPIENRVEGHLIIQHPR